MENIVVSDFFVKAFLPVLKIFSRLIFSSEKGTIYSNNLLDTPVVGLMRIKKN
jgi:hypothetical protein